MFKLLMILSVALCADTISVPTAVGTWDMDYSMSMHSPVIAAYNSRDLWRVGDLL
jgi:hypothetical protein